MGWLVIAIYLAEIGWLLVLIALLVAASSKSRDLRRFADSLGDDFQVPGNISMLVAIAIVAAEWLAVVLLMLGGPARQWGMGLAGLLFILFSVVIAAVLWRKQQVFCHCFGRARKPLSGVDLIRNSIYLAACVFYPLHGQGVAIGEPMAQLALIMMAVVCFLLSISLGEIKQLLRDEA